MILFTTLLGFIETAISSVLGWAENIFGVFGITLIVLFIAMTVSAFFVRHFVSGFFR